MIAQETESKEYMKCITKLLLFPNTAPHLGQLTTSGKAAGKDADFAQIFHYPMCS